MNRLLLVAVLCITKPVVGNAVGAGDAAGGAVDNAAFNGSYIYMKFHKVSVSTH